MILSMTNSPVPSPKIQMKQIPKHFNVPFAIQHGYFRCVRYLLELSSDPNERDNQLRTPLILCSYVENDRWSLSLAQNLLEKGGKIALEDNARRNALHHACAMQRVHLVELFLSCLEFDFEAKDCEGNTCLHYVAITGNCEIAEILMRKAEKLQIALDQSINREGCSAAVLALKYGHIECANQITHRDSDEFFVIPRPLSIYENSNLVEGNSQKLKKTKKPNKEISPSTLSFGLLKIIFNEADSNYSARLAGFCKNDSKKTRRKRKSSRNVEQFSSTDALVNEFQRLTAEPEKPTEGENENFSTRSGRTSPRFQMILRQCGEEKISLVKQDEDEEIRSNRRVTLNLDRPKTSAIRSATSSNAVAASSRLGSAKSSPSQTKTKSNAPNGLLKQISHGPTELSNYSRTLYAGRPLSAALAQNRTPIGANQNDFSCSIREAKGAASRFNDPEQVFGLKPEQLFKNQQNSARTMESRSMNDHRPSKLSQKVKQTSLWQEEVSRLVDLYNIHHSANYRASAVPPPPQPTTNPPDLPVDLNQINRNRKVSIARNISTLGRTSRGLTTGLLNSTRRTSVAQRTPIKSSHT